ncbi:MAG: S41 family peptidase [Bryobacteraceae bacterium]
MRRRLSFVALTIALLWSGAAGAQTGPTNCSVASQNLYVRDVLNDIYLWYQFLPTVNPTSFRTPEAYLDAVRYRPIDNTYSYITTEAANDALYDDSQYIGFGFSTQILDSAMYVSHVFEGSAGQAAGLDRGTRITQINGQPVEALIANGTIGSAFGPSEIGVQSTISFLTRDGASRQASMTKTLVTIPTVSLTSVFNVEGRKIGYLHLRNFVRPTFEALDQAFEALKQAGATELVLDLRYNGGGLVNVAVHLASLIGGSLTSGQVLAVYDHNDKNRAYNRTLRFEEPSHSLNLKQLVVITTRSTASASELIINSLRPYIPVAIIGEATYGKPVGQYGIPFCTKILAPVAFSLRNASGQGDYFDGLQPTCAAADDVTHELGDVREASFAEAITFLRTGNCSAPATSATESLRVRARGPKLTGFAALINAW